MFRRRSSSAKQTLQRQRQRKGWVPPAIRWWNLVIAILLCWSFIAVLHYFLRKSQTEGGIIFAADVNKIALNRSFWYLYLPTIVAVVFSIFVVWIDHDAKRFEPYRQMSKPNGALGKDSMLLQYPFDFMPAVPFTAFKRRHWLVFWASTGAVLTTFGIVPFQAGIFSTKTVTQYSTQSFQLSRKYAPSASQKPSSVVNYAQSVYGILKLNETLPAYTTRDYTLAPFAPQEHVTSDETGTWTSNTTLYGMDVQCKQVEPRTEKKKLGPVMTWFNISTTCEIFLRNINNDTIGDGIEVESKDLAYKIPFKTYTSFFLAYNGYFADNEMLGTSWPCFQKTNGSFLAAFVRNKSQQDDNANKITAIACKPFYYEYEAEATVDIETRAPITVIPRGTKQPLSSAVFNATVFEQTLATGARSHAIDRGQKDRDGDMPGADMPRYLERLSERNLTTFQNWALLKDLPPMTAMAITMSDRGTEEFLDPIILGKAYESAYKLLFARSMAGILKTDFSSATIETNGRRVVHVEAVALEPVFTYIVEILLGVLSLVMGALLYFAVFKSNCSRLIDDPSSIAAVMSMVADNPSLLSSFEALDCCTDDYMLGKIQNRGYALGDANTSNCIFEVVTSLELEQRPLHRPSLAEVGEPRVAQPMRPLEFRLYTAIPVVSLFVALAVTLAVLFAKSQNSGLPLPSTSTFIQNLVSGYMPTAVATLIEPLWILVNRLLCMLQPFEELRSSKATASKSLSLNYTSLPPPLTLFKAARAGHLLLFTVCAMSLLANLLATTFAGLFFQQLTPIGRSTSFSPPLDPRLVSINGSSGPPTSGHPIDSDAQHSGAYQGNSGDEQFLVSESNYTRNTALPSWVDETAMYLPFDSSQGQTQDVVRQAHTKYFSGVANCNPLIFGVDYQMALWNVDRNSTDPGQNSRNGAYKLPKDIFEIQVSGKQDDQVTCYASQWREVEPENDPYLSYLLGSHSRFPEDCLSGNTAAELQTTLVAATNATEYEQQTCRSAVALVWMRRTQSQCPEEFQNSPEDDGFEEANEKNTLLVTCQPQLAAGDAQIRVDGKGVLLERATNLKPDQDQSLEALTRYDPKGGEDLIAQSNLFLFRSQRSGWHNDSYASEYFHHFVNQAAGGVHLTNPNTPLPTFADVEEPLNKAYMRLFAIWLGLNKELLFEPVANASTRIEGLTITQEERLFFTFPLFVISEVILIIYIVVSVLVYLRRPGRYLPRMPTSTAAVIALFASSAAVKDLQNTTRMVNKEKEEHLRKLDCRYGYGSYVGGDGSVHVGIEKAPFVRYMKETRFMGSRFEKELRRRKALKGEVVEYIALERQEGTVE